MHMADALVAPAVAGTMYACSAAAAGWAVKKVQEEDDPKKVPLMGVMGAFVFAGQMINFTIPGTGSSGHLCGGMLVSAVLGPFAGFLTMIGVLLIQCLLFADGGLLALGCNIWNMAFYGWFIGAGLLWRRIMKNGPDKKKITYASVIGCILTLQLGALSVTAETLASGITELPFAVFAAAMQPIHLVIGLVEGLITAAVLCFLYEARPELIWTGDSGKEAEALFPKSAACAHRSIYTDRRSIISGGICKPGRAGMVHTKNNRVRGACGVRSGSRCGGEDPESDLPSAGLFYPGPGDDAWNFSVRHLRRTGSHRIMYSRLLSVRPV